MHMHVAGVSVFAPRVDGPLCYEDVVRVVEARLHLAPRLRQRVLPDPRNLARPLSVNNERFDLDFHLRRAAIPSPGGRLQLERAVGRVLSAPSTARSRCGSSTSTRGWQKPHRRPAEAPPRAGRRYRRHVDRLGAVRPAAGRPDRGTDRAMGRRADALERGHGPRRDPRDNVRTRSRRWARWRGRRAEALEAIGHTLSGMGSIVGIWAPCHAVLSTCEDRAGTSIRDGGGVVRTDAGHQASAGRDVNDVVLTAVAIGLHTLLAARGDTTGAGRCASWCRSPSGPVPRRGRSGTASRRRSSSSRRAHDAPLSAGGSVHRPTH